MPERLLAGHTVEPGEAFKRGTHCADGGQIPPTSGRRRWASSPKSSTGVASASGWQPSSGPSWQ
eukprot:8267846-Alexandrium_andersonii.AAC.1